MNIATIGLDVAKNVFQVHGADAEGRAVLRQRLRRNQVASFFANVPPCVVGLEACCGSHYWSRVFGGTPTSCRPAAGPSGRAGFVARTDNA
jgi:transposase